MTVKPPAPPPLPSELEQLLRRMRLPYIRKAAPEALLAVGAFVFEAAKAAVGVPVVVMPPAKVLAPPNCRKPLPDLVMLVLLPAPVRMALMVSPERMVS